MVVKADHVTANSGAGWRRGLRSSAAIVLAAVLVPGLVQAQQTVVGGAGNDYQTTVLVPRAEPDARIAVFERLSGPSSLGDLWLTRSDDAGATWTTPAAIIATAANERHASLVQTSDDGYALFFLRDEGGNSFRIHRATSTDGSTWIDRGRAELGWPGAGEINPEVFRRADGTLIMTYQRLGGAVHLAVSEDEGASWDQLRTQLSPGTAALPRLVVRESDGTHLLVYQTGSSAVSLWLRQSDDPHVWTDTPQLLTPDGNNHDAMPVVLDDGSFVVLWARVIGGAFQLVSAHSLNGRDWLPMRQLSDRPGLHNIQPRALPGDGYGRLELYWGAAQTPGQSNHDIVREAEVLVAEMIVFNVDTAVDSIDANPGDGDCADAEDACSLRAAIIEANALGGRQRIQLPAGNYTLSLAGDQEDGAASGDLDIVDHLELVGAGAETSVIDADGIDRVFDLGPLGSAPEVTMTGIAITGGRQSSVQVPEQEARGGGLRVGPAAVLTLDDSRVADNQVSLLGGGIFNQGRLTFRRGVIEDNAVTGGFVGGGGLASGANATAWALVQDSIIRRNVASRGAGVGAVRDSVMDFGQLTIERSVIVDNQGFGFYGDAGGTFVLDSSTVSGNTQGGLFIDNHCDTLVRFSTIAGNLSPAPSLASGIRNMHGPANPFVRLQASVVADNEGGDCQGPMQSLGRNLVQSASCWLVDEQPGDLIGVAALLTPLQDAHTVSPFHGLLPGSPAIDAADADCPLLDQLGESRPLDGDGDGTALCDIGAIEQPYSDVVFADGFEGGD